MPAKMFRRWTMVLGQFRPVTGYSLAHVTRKYSASIVFLVCNHVGVLERGQQGLITLLRVADEPGVEPGELVDDLPTSFRRLGAEWAKLIIRVRQGITTDGIAEES